MFRFFLYVIPVILLFTFMSDANTSLKINNSSCLKCHEKTYREAISLPYQHSVINDSCKVCHVIEERDDDSRIVLWSSSFQTEGTIFLGTLETVKKYKVSVEVNDGYGKKSKLKKLTIKPVDILKSTIDTSQIKLISAVKLEEIKKGMFVEATISWNTDVPATSEIEYRAERGKYRKMSSEINLFTNSHRAILNGLKHKSKYLYRVISRDISGNILKSGEYSLNTSQNKSRNTVPVKISEQIRELPTLITKLSVLNIKDTNDYYIKIAANKNTQFKVKIKHVEEEQTRPCIDFKQTRYSTIDVCITCHPQDSSHPVGVRSNNPKIVVSNYLPTIENGIITCVTCHFSHGGKKPYYVRVDFTQEICVKCHQTYFKY